MHENIYVSTGNSGTKRSYKHLERKGNEKECVQEIKYQKWPLSSQLPSLKLELVQKNSERKLFPNEKILVDMPKFNLLFHIQDKGLSLKGRCGIEHRRSNMGENVGVPKVMV